MYNITLWHIHVMFIPHYNNSLIQFLLKKAPYGDIMFSHLQPVKHGKQLLLQS